LPTFSFMISGASRPPAPKNRPCYIDRVISTVLYRPCYIDRVISIVLYQPCYIDRVISTVLYPSCYIDRVISTVLYPIMEFGPTPTTSILNHIHLFQLFLHFHLQETIPKLSLFYWCVQSPRWGITTVGYYLSMFTSI
jgi:hypothetical protein